MDNAIREQTFPENRIMCLDCLGEKHDSHDNPCFTCNGKGYLTSTEIFKMEEEKLPDIKITVYTVMCKDCFGKDNHGVCSITALKSEAESLLHFFENKAEDSSPYIYYIKEENEVFEDYIKSNAVNILPKEIDYLLSLVEDDYKQRVKKLIIANKY